MKDIAQFPARDPAQPGTVNMQVTAKQLDLLQQVFDKVPIFGRADVRAWADLIQVTEDAVARLREGNRGS